MTLTLSEFVSALSGWKARRGPTYRRLADAVRDALAAGRFPLGTVLPPERRLAETLGFSRTTVESSFCAGTVPSHDSGGTRHVSQLPHGSLSCPK